MTTAKAELDYILLQARQAIEALSANIHSTTSRPTVAQLNRTMMLLREIENSAQLGLDRCQ